MLNTLSPLAERKAETRYLREKKQGFKAPEPVRPSATIRGVLAIPLSTHGEFELTDTETAKFRRLIYGINKDAIRRYRTMRDGKLLMVWRIR